LGEDLFWQKWTTFAGFARLRRLTAIGQRRPLSKLDLLGCPNINGGDAVWNSWSGRRSRDGTRWRVRDNQLHISGFDGLQLKPLGRLVEKGRKINDMEKWKNALTDASGYGS
jgi:hypothetical protein